jgi:hypothetical protein
MIKRVMGGDGEGRTGSVYSEHSSHWALYGSVFLVLLVVIGVIGYHLVPAGAIENAKNMWAEQQAFGGSSDLRGDTAAKRENWERGFSTRQHPHLVTVTIHGPLNTKP